MTNLEVVLSVALVISLALAGTLLIALLRILRRPARPVVRTVNPEAALTRALSAAVSHLMKPHYGSVSGRIRLGIVLGLRLMGQCHLVSVHPTGLVCLSLL